MLRLLPASLLILIFACTPKPAPHVQWDGRRVAILPFGNESNDIEGPERVRTALERELRGRGYRLVPRFEVDSAMAKLGVSEGDQLRAVARGALIQVLEADVYCKGVLVDYVFKSMVAISQRRVELQLACEDRQGAPLFEGSGVGVASKAGLDAAGDLALNLSGKVVKSVKDSGKKILPGQAAKNAADATDVVADVELTSEMKEAVRKLLSNFPR